jgi:hypothetical protein
MSEPTTATPHRLRWLTRPGAWFWIAVAIGVAARLYLAFASVGTEDAALWMVHGSQASEHGLMRCYAGNPLFIHPPPISWTMARLWDLSVALDIRFHHLLRAVLTLVDVANAFLILRVLSTSPWRWIATAGYCLAPAAILLSGQHGNTDPAIAMLLLCAALCVGSARALAAGAVVGLAAWVKIPGLLAAPAIVLAFPRWRQRIACAATAAVGAAAPFALAAWQAENFAAAHPRWLHGRNVVLERVFQYRGLEIGIPGESASWMWGLRNFSARAFGADPSAWPAWVRAWHAHNEVAALTLCLAFAFLRRRATTAREVAITLTGTYAIFFACIDNWATQYLAWCLPFAVLAGWRTALLVHLVAGGYVYGLYAWVTQDWLVRGPWRYALRTGWPTWLIVMRDAAVLAFAVLAAVAIVRAAKDEIAFWRARQRGVVMAT